LNINGDIVYRKIISYANVIKIKANGKYLFETKCKPETKVKGGDTPKPLWLAGS
jgi:hypothetical protein